MAIEQKSGRDQIEQQLSFLPAEVVRDTFDKIVHHEGLLADANSLIRRRNQHFKELPIEELDAKVVAEFKDIYQLYFADDGLLDGFSEDERHLQQSKLLTSFLLGHYAHQGITRDSGESYYQHPSFVAHYLALNYRLPIEYICMAYDHDVVEDSTKKNKKTGKMHPYPVSEVRMREICGEKITSGVMMLTKVRDTQKRSRFDDSDEGLIATRMQLVECLISDPNVVLIKVIDRLHNMRTLSGKKDVAKRINTAQDTRFYVGLAKKLGLTREAQELEELSFRVLRPELAAQIDYLQKTYGYESLQIGALEESIGSLLGDYYGGQLDAQRVKVSVPTAPEIARRVSNGNIPQSADLSYNIEIILPQDISTSSDQFYPDNQIFFLRAVSIHALLCSNKSLFRALAEHNLGYATSVDLLSERKGQDELNLTMFDRQNRRVNLRIVKEGHHIYEHTPLTYASALSMLPGDPSVFLNEQAVFEAKHRVASMKSHDLAMEIEHEKATSTAEGMIDALDVPFHNEIRVTGHKLTRAGNVEEKTRVMLKGATLLDYLLSSFPQNWWKIPTSTVDGFSAAVEDLLTDNAVINCEIESGDTSYVDISWLDAISTLADMTFDDPRYQNVSVSVEKWIERELLLNEQTTEAMLREKLNSTGIFECMVGTYLDRKIKMLPSTEQQKYREIVRLRGSHFLKERMPLIENVDTHYAVIENYFATESTEEFMYRLGLGMVSSHELQDAADFIREFWEGLAVIAIRPYNESGALEMLSSVFTDIHLSIQHSTVWNNAANPGETWVIFRVYKGAKDYGYLGESLSDLFEKQQAIFKSNGMNVQESEVIRRFENNHEFKSMMEGL